MRRERSSVTLFVACLVTGGVACLAVAWSLQARSRRPDFRTLQRYWYSSVQPVDITQWKLWTENDWPDEPLGSARFSAVGIRYQLLSSASLRVKSDLAKSDQYNLSDETRQGYWVQTTETGWPLPFIRVQVASRAGLIRTTPIVGAVVDTLLWGTVLWILVLGLAKTKEKLKRSPAV